MFLDLTSTKNRNFLKQISKEVIQKESIYLKPRVIKGFIYYGSHVTNLNISSSDVDVMVIISNWTGPKKEKYQIKNNLVKLYFLSERDILKDARKNDGGHISLQNFLILI